MFCLGCTKGRKISLKCTLMIHEWKKWRYIFTHLAPSFNSVIVITPNNAVFHWASWCTPVHTSVHKCKKLCPMDCTGVVHQIYTGCNNFAPSIQSVQWCSIRRLLLYQWHHLSVKCFISGVQLHYTNWLNIINIINTLNWVRLN